MSLSGSHNVLLNKIPELTDKNWWAFKKPLRMFFLAVGLPGVVDGVVPTDEGELKKWKALDSQMVAYIYSKVSDDYAYLVEDLSSAKEAWEALKGHFEKTSLASRISARESLYSIFHDPSRPIDSYIKDVSSSCAMLKALGVTVSDDEIINLILMHLDPSFHHVRTSIILSAETDPTKKITLAHVKSVLGTSVSANTSSVPHIKQEDSGGSGLALAARIGGRGRSGGFGGQGSGLGSGGSGTVDGKGYRWCDPSKEGCCHRCGRQGHQAYRCIYDMPSHIKDSVMGNRSPSPHRSAALASAAAFASASDPHHSSIPHASSASVNYHAAPLSVSFNSIDDFDHFPQDSGSEDGEDEYDIDVIRYSDGGMMPIHT